MQTRAEDALASVPQPAAIVALRPSTGAVLAVAQNAPADAQGAIALTGLYQPGSTFKTVTTSAALQAGRSTRTPCCRAPAPRTSRAGRSRTTTISISGHVPLHSAFAHSCHPRWGAGGVVAAGCAATGALSSVSSRYGPPGADDGHRAVPTAKPAERVESAIGQGAG
ncbi:hypothetical protein GS831_24125 [Rhodococcus hoagii]|nr:hypothetical protein [Prescottella equi]